MTHYVPLLEFTPLNAFEIKKATDAIDGTILWVWG